MCSNKFNGFPSYWHIIYGAIILAILAIFLLLIAPGRINESAFSHFSFASTLISIVLAVVSIVYSLQSGLSNNSYKSRMDEIHNSIQERMKNLQEVEISLKNLVEEHKNNLKGNAKNGKNDIVARDSIDK